MYVNEYLKSDTLRWHIVCAPVCVYREYREEGADPTVSAPVPMEELVRAYR